MVSASGCAAPLQCVAVCVSDPLCCVLNHLRCALVTARKMEGAVIKFCLSRQVQVEKLVNHGKIQLGLHFQAEQSVVDVSGASLLSWDGLMIHSKPQSSWLHVPPPACFCKPGSPNPALPFSALEIGGFADTSSCLQ